jgi:ATP-dependent helicase YprA (DUF1998 family)
LSLTIGQTIEQLHRALRDYIEAAYHVSNPVLVEQRREVLDHVGTIHQTPYIESTPRYRTGTEFREIRGLDTAVTEVFGVLSIASDGLPVVIHDPPFEHQAESVRNSLVDGKSLIVMTGTGSGKTECFLLPILGKLASEAKNHPTKFRQSSAIRAIVLYPMNALVNDQLGRLRLLFSDLRLVKKFMGWAGRPARFARYTSRTLYPGVRTAKRDQQRLASLADYYVRHLEASLEQASPEQAAALKLVNALKLRGKWPAKPDLLAWFGKSGSRWQDHKSGAFRRCITLPEDPELLTRHEVQEAPPDILVTNYSMLEYMLMRPLERPIFESTRNWLEQNPDEKLILVIDEAHLYRGAAGAEVALLVRRLRKRLGLTASRLQVICTSASFGDPNSAAEFAAQLTGKHTSDFVTVEGKLFLRKPVHQGTQADAEALARVDLGRFYDATEEVRLKELFPFLEYRSATKASGVEQSLYEALFDFPPMNLLVNTTMQEACPLQLLGAEIFPGVNPALANTALTTLMALGSVARKAPTEPGLLPCRVHAFYRGLPGLWVCMDSGCSELTMAEKGGPAGKLYAQPRETCRCGARVLELYTCRNCGTAYARAYTDNVAEPNFLWAEPGSVLRTFRGELEELEPLDLLLEPPVSVDVEPADFDIITGRLNPSHAGARTRRVFLRKDRTVNSKPEGEDEPPGDLRPGEFRPCAVCDQTASFGRTSVQDHQTKGDQPFQALITKQLQVQPPNSGVATHLAPLRGRKVLIFSDSRQTAARLAPNLQRYSTQDAIRPIIIVGFLQLQELDALREHLCLEDLYFAVLLAAKNLGVRLRPELKTGEHFNEENLIEQALQNGVLKNQSALLGLYIKLRSSSMPEALLSAVYDALSDRYYGLESLALASLIERPIHTTALTSLPDIPEIADSTEKKLALTRVWLRYWQWQRNGFWLEKMPAAWWTTRVRAHASGKFAALKHVLTERGWRTTFERNWLPRLLELFTEPVPGNQFRLKGSEISLHIGGEWAYCKVCRTVQRPYPGRSVCSICGRSAALPIDSDSDPVFTARKGYYRASTVEALRKPPTPPIALIAAEHTAQLNSPQAEDVFSKAEEHELLFQDIDLGLDSSKRERPAIDVLSCTTTMEVGIDIGNLSGISLRNMPPARANYQQRAGRAGRRGNAVATVTAFGSADSHDEHYFSKPDEMIRGKVLDPKLTLDNYEIARRHVTAYLLQRYHGDRLPDIDPQDQPHLFAVLGTVHEFKNSQSLLNRNDLEKWLTENLNDLRTEVSDWLPLELNPAHRSLLLEKLLLDTMLPIDAAIEFVKSDPEPSVTTETKNEEASDVVVQEVPAEADEEAPSGDPAAQNLLDRLLYKGVLPRYAFPTDVATFYVFDADRSSRFRPVFQFTPSQGLSVALSQYAPGKEVWIAGKRFSSGAIYSPIGNDRFEAWQNKRLYFECSICHFGYTVPVEEGNRGESLDCEACGGAGTFGPGRYWLRPPGFAHPVDLEEETSPDDQPTRSYATRAKLVAPTSSVEGRWTEINPRLKAHHLKDHLLVTNRGPKHEEYSYCTKCGRIEPSTSPVSKVLGSHLKPFPDNKEPVCPGGGTSRGIVLGTDFITDVPLILLTVERPISLLPGLMATDIVLRTLSEALSKAATSLLELEATEIQAEYRPALTALGKSGTQAEIYLYDTLPGGAGFVAHAGQLRLSLFQKALSLLEQCPEGCDRSCYRCLRSYKNKFEHDLLDRHLGAALLRHLLTGESVKLSLERIRESTDLLHEDLVRQHIEGTTFERDGRVIIPGLGKVVVPILATYENGEQRAIGIEGPLTPDVPADAVLSELKDNPSLPVVLIDELEVRRNLPHATSRLLSIPQ